jgi:hypothetical protein
LAGRYTHGPVHIKIGGEWGMSDEELAFAVEYNFLTPYLLFVKNLWRHGVRADERSKDRIWCGVHGKASR